MLKRRGRYVSDQRTTTSKDELLRAQRAFWCDLRATKVIHYIIVRQVTVHDELTGGLKTNGALLQKQARSAISGVLRALL